MCPTLTLRYSLLNKWALKRDKRLNGFPGEFYRLLVDILSCSTCALKKPFVALYHSVHPQVYHYWLLRSCICKLIHSFLYTFCVGLLTLANLKCNEFNSGQNSFKHRASFSTEVLLLVCLRMEFLGWFGTMCLGIWMERGCLKMPSSRRNSAYVGPWTLTQKVYYNFHSDVEP